jgi:hypothetical protein
MKKLALAAALLIASPAMAAQLESVNMGYMTNDGHFIAVIVVDTPACEIEPYIVIWGDGVQESVTAISVRECSTYHRQTMSHKYPTPGPYPIILQPPQLWARAIDAPKQTGN